MVIRQGVEKYAMTTPRTGSDLNQFLGVVEKYLGSDRVMYTKALVAAFATIAIKDVHQPITLYLIGSAGTGKSTLLRLFEILIPEGLAIREDHFTAKAFVSSQSRGDDDHQDLLPLLKSKVLLTQDLSVLFSKKSTELAETMNVLVLVLDGHGMTYYTSGRQWGYIGNYYMVWFGAIPVLPVHVQKMLPQYGLGSRLLFLKIADSKKTNQEIEDKIVKTISSERDLISKIEIIQTSLLAFLESIQFRAESISWRKDLDSIKALRIISKLAQCLRLLRSGSDKDNKKNPKPVFEANPPLRPAFGLWDICRGMAILHGRNFVKMDDLDDGIVATIALDSGDESRSQIFRKFIIKNSWTFEELSAELKISVDFCIDEIEKLQRIGLVIVKNDKIKLIPYYAELAQDLRSILFPITIPR